MITECGTADGMRTWHNWTPKIQAIQTQWDKVPQATSYQERTQIHNQLVGAKLTHVLNSSPRLPSSTQYIAWWSISSSRGGTGSIRTLCMEGWKMEEYVCITNSPPAWKHRGSLCCKILSQTVIEVIHGASKYGTAESMRKSFMQMMRLN
jgi:hypothetical protein